jgi:hypothetical protein
MNKIKLSVLKNRLSGILSIGYPSFSVCIGYIHTHTRGNLVAHVCVWIRVAIQLGSRRGTVKPKIKEKVHNKCF